MRGCRFSISPELLLDWMNLRMSTATRISNVQMDDAGMIEISLMGDDERLPKLQEAQHPLPLARLTIHNSFSHEGARIVIVE